MASAVNVAEAETVGGGGGGGSMFPGVSTIPANAGSDKARSRSRIEIDLRIASLQGMKLLGAHNMGNLLISASDLRR